MMVLATVGFGLNFWAWGLLAAIGPHLRERFGLDPWAHTLLVAVPLIVGSVGRLPIGVLTDRYGARILFPIVSLATAVPVLALGFVNSLPLLVAAACAAGIGGTAFAVGAPLVSNWYPYGRRGFALGVFSLGTAGSAVGGFAAQRWFAIDGERAATLVLGVLLVGFSVLSALLLRDVIVVRAGTSLWRSCLDVTRLAAGSSLSILYAITFGIVVALAMFLPAYLRTEYHYGWTRAVTTAAALVGLAALARLPGSWLADLLDAVPILVPCYGVAAFFVLVLAFQPPAMVATIALAGISISIGAASGTLLALICKAAPADRIGAAVGLVGAIGGLGGLLAPLAVAVVFVAHSYAIGLTLLAAVLIGAAFYVRAHGPGIGVGLAWPAESAPVRSATTVVVLNAGDAHVDLAAGVARIAELAHVDELVVVYNHTERARRQLSPYALVAALRERLPRHRIVALLLDAAATRGMRGETVLIGELVEVGALPIAITSTGDPSAAAIELAKRLDADQVLGVGYDVARGTQLRPVWLRPTATMASVTRKRPSGSAGENRAVVRAE
jgi:NNP family nitrate/nitrite transporter-like MFS transporter